MKAQINRFIVTLLLYTIIKKIILTLSPKYKLFHLKNHLLELLVMG
jgi:hypothetical protein